jgi:CHAT domain-containing protein
MRSAQLESLHNPSVTHPYCWAAFKIIGDNSNPLRN